MARDTVLVTGANGVVGRRVIAELLRDPEVRIVALVRDLERWRGAARQAGISGARVAVLAGDITREHLGLARERLSDLTGTITHIVHAAADVQFTRPLADARRVNVEGTRQVIRLAERCGALEQLTHVSTAFVCGTRAGVIPEDDIGAEVGWVNAYQQSKYEAEALVRQAACAWIIARSSTIVLDAPAGGISQYTAVHHALRLLYDGLVPMLPAGAGSAVDVVTADFVARSIAALARRPGVRGRTFHLCAGRMALPLAELLALTWARWSEDRGWRRKSIPLPALTDLATYRLFEQSVLETADERLARAVRSMSFFVPELAFGRRFETAGTEATLAESAAPVRAIWPRVLQELRCRAAA
jgi:long-chain acyl-CoA synthetase